MKKTERKRLAQDQIKLLEMSFNANQRLQVDCKLELARRLGLPPRQVAVWYQNRRARQKIQTTEVDYKTIQIELNNVLAENTRLEQELSMLKNELNKARQRLMVSSTSSPAIVTSDNYGHVSSSPRDRAICRQEDSGQLRTGETAFLPDWFCRPVI